MPLIKTISLEKGEGLIGEGSCLYGLRGNISEETDHPGYVVITTRRISFYNFVGLIRIKLQYSFSIPLSSIRSIHKENIIVPQLVISFEKPRGASHGFQGTIFDRDNTPLALTVVIRKRFITRFSLDVDVVYNLLKLILQL